MISTDQHQGVIFDIATATVYARLTPTADGSPVDVQTVALNNDGTMAATGDSAGQVLVWDIETGDILQTHEMCSERRCGKVRFSPDGTLLQTFMNDEGSFDAHFTPDGEQIVSWLIDGFAVWDVESASVVAEYPYEIDDTHTLIGPIYLTDGVGGQRLLCSRPVLDLTAEQHIQYGITDNEPVCPMS